jgi:hypothetical protein
MERGIGSCNILEHNKVESDNLGTGKEINQMEKDKSHLFSS